MPYCPQCRLEYKESATVCSDCQVALVDKLPEELDQQSAAIVHRAKTQEEALMIAAMLEAEGIPAVARSLQIPAVDGLVEAVDACWGVIEVLESDAAAARELIAALLETERPLSDPIPEDAE